MSKVFYFEGNSRCDPGWYFTMGVNKKLVGPHISDKEAELHYQALSETKPLVLWNAIDTCTHPALKEFINKVQHDPEVKFLIKAERSLRSYLLGISIWFLSVPIFWYGVYKFTTWVIS